MGQKEMMALAENKSIVEENTNLTICVKNFLCILLILR
jgi:hypothetical protein